jgi:glycosyltransferase involved in cell wall biosynthesis
MVLLETPWPGRPLRLRLVVGSFRPADRGAVPFTLKANGRSVLETGVKTTPGDYVTLDVTVPGELTRGGKVVLQLESPTYRPFEVGGSSGEPDDYREVGLAVARVMAHHPRHYLYEALFERLVPELGLRLHGLPDERAMGYLETYDVIAPISDFSNRWLERYWAKQGTVLYPPVDVEALSPREPRQPVILSVGRFFRGSHNKKHDVMIRTFGRLVRDGLRGWELHLVGSLTPEASTREAENRRYLDECRRLAQGLPVRLHVDAPAAELKTLYETASIYWHATGYGEHVGRNPAKFEHFGITTVEAMAGGCVPVVIGKGAQPEIVEDGRSGFLWRTATEWRRRTLAVATDARLAERLRRGAIGASKRFSEAVFRAHLLEIVRGLGVAPTR